MANARQGIALCSLCLALTHVAYAQDAATVAEGLFREGVELLHKGEIDQACTKLSESQRLDPSSGTLLNLGDCHEKQGKFASAWGDFLAAQRLAKSQGRPERADEAQKRAAAVEPKLSRLKIVLTEKLPGTRVKVDEVTLEAGALGSSIPIDPGKHSVVISAPGYSELSLDVTIGAERDAQTLTVPHLERAPVTDGPTTSTPVKSSSARRQSPRQPVDSGSPTFAYVVGGLGVVALGAGTVFAFLARSAYDDAKSECPTRTGCSERAMDLRDKAQTRANFANIGIGAGIVGIGVATVLLVTRPSETKEPNVRSSWSVVPTASRTSASISLGGELF